MSKRILVVDDSAAVRRVLREALEPDYEVVEAQDGLTGWLLATAEPVPALVIADVEMPRLNGISMFKRLRTHATGKSIPVVLLTSRDDTPDMIHALQMGVRFYLTKPFHAADVRAKVDKLLQG